MTISKRLITTLAITLCALVMVGVYGARQLYMAQERFHYTMKHTFPSLETLDVAQRALSNARVRSAVYQLASTAEAQQKASQDISRNFQELNQALTHYATHNLSSDDDRTLLQTDQSALQAYQQAIEKVIALTEQGQKNEAFNVAEDVSRPAAIALAAALEKHHLFNIDAVNKLNKDNDAQYSRSIWTLSIIIVAAFLTSIVLAVVLFRIIRAGLTNIQTTLQQVEQSLDFTTRVPILHQDEIGVAASAFNQLLNRLQTNLKDIRSSAGEMARSALQMSGTATQLSIASTTQSESAATMAATMEQMTVSINHVADQADVLHHGAIESGELVKQGSSTIGQTIQDIREISTVVKHSAVRIHELEQSSGKVSRIINMIRDIADQTNLLALNAAIEAARAGESGRGFAVVADEVRKLAERTSHSTSEISDTIETMVSQAQNATEQMESAEQLVEQSVLRADEADQAIRRIGEQTSRATGNISAIASAIKQQSCASNAIASQVEQTAQMSEESSAAARHTAQSAERLDYLAKQQISTLDSYQL